MDQLQTMRPMWVKILRVMYGLAIIFVTYPPFFIFIYFMGIVGFFPDEIFHGTISSITKGFIWAIAIGFYVLTFVSVVASSASNELTPFRKRLLLIPILLFLLAFLLALVSPSYSFPHIIM